MFRAQQATEDNPGLPSRCNDAPIDRLSPHFTGREKELEQIGKALAAVRSETPTRGVIHGMPGLGKTQLALKYAQSSFERQRYTSVFWISAATIEKISQGFAAILDLLGLPGQYHPDQNAKLIAARRWLEGTGSEITSQWLLVLDNADGQALDFLRDFLRRHNSKGNILLTTRSESLAETLAGAAGQRHTCLELKPPDLGDAITLLLEGAGLDTESRAEQSARRKAEELVKSVGCLPLAIDQASSFMKESGKDLDDLLQLYKGEQKIEVGNNPRGRHNKFPQMI